LQAQEGRRESHNAIQHPAACCYTAEHTVLKCTHRGHGTESHGALAGHVGLVLLSELQARSPAVGHDVVHLLGNLVGGQGGQVGEGLELPACGCINVKKSDEGNGGRMGCKQALPRVIVKEAC